MVNVLQPGFTMHPEGVVLHGDKPLRVLQKGLDSGRMELIKLNS